MNALSTNNVDGELIVFQKDCTTLMDDWNTAIQNNDVSQIQILSQRRDALAKRGQELEQKYPIPSAEVPGSR